MNAGNFRLIVFLKAPRLGSVKTRLAATLSDAEALRIHELLVSKTLQAVAELNPVQLAFAPDDAGREVQRWLRAGWTLTPQGDGDLGERLARAFGSAFAEGARQVVVIGSDCPDLTVHDVRDARSALAGHDVVLGPAADGGYWLIGLRSPQPALFEGIAWSTDQVLGQTLGRAQSSGLSVSLLRLLRDVDTEPDWRKFEQGRVGVGN